MENNAHAKKDDSAQSNGAGSNNNATPFPDNDETKLQDFSTILGHVPVLQQKSSPPPKAGSEIASKDDFAEVEEARPFARKLAPRTLASAALAVFIVLPMSLLFIGGSGSKNKPEKTAVNVEAASEAGSISISSEAYEAQQAEMEQLRSQQAFLNQQVDAEAIDAAGRARQQQQRATNAAAQPDQASTSTTASKPVTATTTSPASVTVRATPARPAPAAAAVQRVPAAAYSPAPATSSSPSASAPEPEPVDPFERRAQLQALGSYGAPPPMARTSSAQPGSYAQATNPFETQYIQTIAIEAPQAQPAFSTVSTAIGAPLEAVPLTPEDRQYQLDAAAVLAAAIPDQASDLAAGKVEENDVATVLGADAKAVEKQTSEASREPAAPMAIMPGTSAEAELPYGFSWQQGTPLPEVLIITTEDVMASEITVIPAGSQFLGQAQIDPASGAVTIQVVGLFGETKDVQIPSASVIVQAVDGSVLTAKASDTARASAGSNLGGFLMESLGNSVGNVIDSDDSLITDIAGGVAETVIDGQVQHAEASTAARNARAAAQPIVWTLDSRAVRLTFNHYIPLSTAER